MGIGGTAENFRKEGKELIEGYFALYPGVKRYMEESVEKARKKGYVETIMGRRRYLRDINSRNAVVRGVAERNAVNAPIQGSAADIIKKAMICIHQKLKERGLRSKMILQVHDELNFKCHHEEIEELKNLVVGLHGTRRELSGAFNRGYGLWEKLVRGTLMLEYKDVVGNVGQANRFSYNG